MESIIIYEFARNNIYGSLARNLEGLRHNAMGLLVEKRARDPAFKNDSFFYLQVGMASFMIAALQGFCQERLRGEDYYEARERLLKKFTLPDVAPLDEAQFKLFLPSYMQNLDHKTDDEKNALYRYRFLDEFRTTMQMMDVYMRHNSMMSWSGNIMLDHIYSRLDQFIDPAEAEKGFGKFPVTKEAQYFADAARWLKERSAMAQVRSLPFITTDMQALGGVFEKAANDTALDKMRLAQYGLACEAMGASIASLLTGGGYIPILREGFSKKARLKAIENHYTADMPVDLPLVLEKYVEGFRMFHQLHIRDSDAPAGLRGIMQQGLDDMISDLKDGFIRRDRQTATVRAVPRGKEMPALV